MQETGTLPTQENLQFPGRGGEAQIPYRIVAQFPSCWQPRKSGGKVPSWSCHFSFAPFEALAGEQFLFHI